MQLTLAMPDPRLQPYISVYYLFEEERPVIDDAQRADCGHLRLFLEGEGHQNMPNGERLPSTPGNDHRSAFHGKPLFGARAAAAGGVQPDAARLGRRVAQDRSKRCAR